MHHRLDPAGSARAAAGATLLVLAPLGLASHAAAEPSGHFTATYDISFLGLPVGEANLAISRDGERYALDLGAGLRGVAGFFVDGSGTATVSGRRGRTGAVSGAFHVESRYAGKPIRVAMQIADGRARDVTVEPEPTPRADRVPVTPQDRTGIVDPLTMLAIPAGSAPLASGLCDRRIPVFDGASRADLVLSRGSLVTVRDGAYRGPALDCRVRWVPIAGHRANGPNVRRMAANDDMQVRLAPALDGVLLPLAISVATGWGTVRIEARRWGGPDRPAEEAGRPSVKVSLPAAR
ncbi:DUF3108 domain-containing protein [Methylobacterium symbioticum]|uniref:DUF3108 domain-containing protein n=1 Tax=Methylobacterium symbioticum TaxID=2584084 RepID=A0A509EI32_9HYPH|nr:DUF3108 domain-containing protein [Methylobacterium symbioticum]VUD73294.1 hypothetical protein MET9862_03909 [Methylobacterium symbioticum]